MEDVFILCQWQYVHSIADALTLQLRDSNASALVLARGSTGKSSADHMGFIVVEWEEKAPAEFLHQLDIDQDITNYALYDVPTYYEGVASSTL